jgi:hypothetical protein
MAMFLQPFTKDHFTLLRKGAIFLLGYLLKDFLQFGTNPNTDILVFGHDIIFHNLIRFAIIFY